MKGEAREGGERNREKGRKEGERRRKGRGERASYYN